MSEPSISISARVGFHAVEEIPPRLAGIDFPIELALPWRYAMWEIAVRQWEEMVALLTRADVEVRSVHATQGPISDPAFVSWGRMTCELAERLGASVVTVHPNRSRRARIEAQGRALEHLRAVQSTTGVTVSVETFGGAQRVLTPEELMGLDLPMTLDTAHIHDDATVLQIVKRYWRRIPVVHLSARGASEHHLPIDAFCIRVARLLRARGWTGHITLEYLPWHHYRLRPDMGILNEALVLDKAPRHIPPPNDAYRHRPEMWSPNAPAPGERGPRVVR